MLSDKELEELERKLEAVRNIKAKYGYPKDDMFLVPDDKVAEFNVAMDHVINGKLELDYIEEHERLHAEAARDRRDTRMRVLALFVGGILLGASTVGMCILGPTATAWTLPLVSTLGCFAVSLGLVLMGSIKSL